MFKEVRRLFATTGNHSFLNCLGKRVWSREWLDSGVKGKRAREIACEEKVRKGVVDNSLLC
jgi:hypothetical protein